MRIFPPPPLRDAIADQTGEVRPAWQTWLLSIKSFFGMVPQILRRVSLTAHGAAIGTTAFPVGTLAPGLYRITTYARITRAGTVSSSLTLTFAWTDGGVACTLSLPANTGNTTATVQTAVLMVKVDAASPLSYSAAYVSVGATTMQFLLELLLEQVA